MDKAQTQDIAAWASRLGLRGYDFDALAKIMANVPAVEAAAILEAVSSTDGSEVKYCADRVVQEWSNSRNDLVPCETHAVLSVVPSLSEVFLLFADHDQRQQKDVQDDLESALAALVETNDLDDEFVYNSVSNGNLLNELRGALICRLVGEYDDHQKRNKWLGKNYQSLAPYAETMRAQRRADKKFCKSLLEVIPALSEGML